MHSIAAALGLLLVSACGADEFTCRDSTQCGPEGTCEASGHCSFPDPTCDSGRRYGEHASTLSGACVSEGETLGGTDGGPDGSSGAGSGDSMTSQADGPDPTTSGGGPTSSDGSTSIDPTSTSDDAESGAESETSEPEPLDEPIVLYTFEEGEGTAILDRSGHDPAIDLQVMNGTFTWIEGGLRSNGSGIAISSAPTTRVVDACAASNEFTVEAWITPESLEDAGPARIVSMSYDYNTRNFTLGQNLETYIVRMRTTGVDDNGEPQSNFAGLELARTHVVYTRDSEGIETFYIDGSATASGNRDGELTNWTDDFAIMLGNENATERPWHGVFHRVALYDRALGADRVQAHYEAGPWP